MNNATKMFGDHGDVSSMRVIFALVPAVVLLAWVAVNIVNLIRAPGMFQLVDIPQNVVMLLGALTAGKVTQKFAEKKDGSHAG